MYGKIVSISDLCTSTLTENAKIELNWIELDYKLNELHELNDCRRLTSTDVD